MVPDLLSAAADKESRAWEQTILEELVEALNQIPQAQEVKPSHPPWLWTIKAVFTSTEQKVGSLPPLPCPLSSDSFQSSAVPILVVSPRRSYFQKSLLSGSHHPAFSMPPREPALEEDATGDNASLELNRTQMQPLCFKVKRHSAAVHLKSRIPLIFFVLKMSSPVSYNVVTSYISL